MSLSIQGIRPNNPYRSQCGFTIIEVLVAVVLLAIGTALAIPSYVSMVEKRQLTSAAEQLVSFVNATQGVASRTNQIVTVSFNHDGYDDWCVGATMGPDACDCEETVATESDFCEIDSEPYVLNQDVASAPELMHGMSGAAAYSFDPVRGIFIEMDDSVTLEMHARSRDYKLNMLVNSTGRVTLCSKDSAHAVPGYDLCPVEEES